jgi:ribonuclease P protein component
MMMDASAEPIETASAPQRLRRRKDFVRAAASGVAQHARAFKLQMAARPEDSSGEPRFGFTVTKKTAGAVGRNRIRRRLKEALRLSKGLAAQSGHDYVFIARHAALSAPFPELMTQMAETLHRVHGRGGAAAKRRNPNHRPPAQ